MPELPEVETVRRVLRNNLKNLSIDNIESNYPEMVDEDFNNFKANLIGKTFIDIERKGKFLIFKLNDINLVSHLRMEGKFYYQKNTCPTNPHIHMIFHLNNGYDLRYQDTRKFGRMVTKSNSDLYTTPPISKLAKDANDPSFTLDIFKEKISKKKKSIKEILLNQEIIAGLGNIYVDEVLAMCHINPLKEVNKLSDLELNSILLNSRLILDKAIEYKGTTIRSYTSSLGVYGGYQQFLLVHTKTSCPYCNNKLNIIRVGGRGTYYCEKCQK